ncbi:MAG: menaquinone-specific isochorismate synthase [Solirubrobacteraceae bacterium]|nr:menaquinone-specific isochorismate synthase [Solirubrobacteraceae bacterium]
MTKGAASTPRPALPGGGTEAPPRAPAAQRVYALSDRDRKRLRKRLEQAVHRARRAGGPGVLAALTVAVDRVVDPAAVAFACRRPREPWFCIEQPDRERSAIASVGCVVALEERGPQRFEQVAARWRALAAEAVCDAADGRGAGLIASGGFAFAPDGGGGPHWSAFAPASLHVPEASLARRGDDVTLTLAALAQPDDTADGLLARVERRLEELRRAAFPLLDPDPVGRCTVAASTPREHYEAAVARAVERIRAGELEKIVLAREVQVLAPGAHDAAAVFGVLREGFPACFCFCAGRGDDAFVAASPELLIRREGMRASTLALAGSTRRSADPSVDEHLGEQLLRSDKDRAEQAIVVRRIERALRPHSVWVTTAQEPVIVRMANIQHLASPIRAQLRNPLGVVRLAGLLHPTPAVGGEPFAVAEPLIPALEGLDRGWYAGPVGWTDTNEDGEFCVALRCALLSGPVARCYAGVGVVRDSDPAAELAETDVKLAALLPVLAG